MTFSQIQDIIVSTADLAVGLAVPSALSYSGGYLYGAFCGANHTVAACAFLVSTLVYYAFQAMVQAAIGGEKRDPKAFYATQVLGLAILGSIQIYLYREMNLIATFGTTILSSLLFVGTLTYLNKLEAVIHIK